MFLSHLTGDEGFEKGFEEGKQQGLGKGSAQKLFEIVFNMLEKDMNKSTISELTDLSEYQIDILKVFMDCGYGESYKKNKKEALIVADMLREESLKQSMEQGIQEALQKGRQKGQQEGWNESMQHIAMCLLKEGMSTQKVAEITGLTKLVIEDMNKVFES